MNLPTPDALQVTLTASTLLVIWIAWAKYLGPRIKAKWVRFVGFFQTIAGRDPIVDKVTGKEVSPAVLPLGEHLASINDNMAQLIEVVRSNQDAHHRIDGHETRINALESGRVERIVSQAESAEMWRAVANQSPDLMDES